MSKQRKREDLRPGKGTAIRFTRDFPEYVLEFLNENKDIPFSEIIKVGTEHIMNQEQQGFFLPSASLTPEKIKKIQQNPALVNVALKIIDELLFSDKPLHQIFQTSMIPAEEMKEDPEQQLLSEEEKEMIEMYKDDLMEDLADAGIDLDDL